MSHLSMSSIKLRHWITQQALPFWGSKGRDLSGGFFEQLYVDGAPDLQTTRRVRVQARQTYVFAHAAHLKWSKTATQASDHGWHYLTTKGFQGGDQFALESGFKGCAHLLNADSSINDAYRDTYAQAFIMLSGFWRFKAFGDQAALATAYETLTFLDTHLSHPNGGWYEGLPINPKETRRQNPHMHIFEAILAGYEFTNDPKLKARADDLFALFEQHFFCQKDEILLEFFADDWQACPETGHLTEPGHMMEWCWLLRWYERLTGVNVDKYADKLYSQAIQYGLNAQSGLLCDEIDNIGTKTKPTARSWPQTEYVKASIAQARAGRKECENLAAQMIDRMFETYLPKSLNGGWYDKMDQHGQPMEGFMSSSTFYHLFCMAAEVENYVQEEQRDIIAEAS